MARRPRIAEQIDMEAVVQMPSQAAPVAAPSNPVAVVAPTVAPAAAAAHAVASETAALISMIERAARDPNVDIDKMERLFQMRERIVRESREAAFNAAMAAAQEELRPVVRKLQNKQTNSSYADLAAISEGADPIIHKHGFGCIFSEFQSERERHIGVRIKVTHAAGHSDSHDFHIPVDDAGIKGQVNKTPVHAYSSTLTYGRRVAKCAVFDIATKNDTDGNQPQNEPQGVISDDQQAELMALITKAEIEIDAVLEYHKIESLADMPVRDFAKSKMMLETRIKKLAKDKQAVQQNGEG